MIMTQNPPVQGDSDGIGFFTFSSNIFLLIPLRNLNNSKGNYSTYNKYKLNMAQICIYCPLHLWYQFLTFLNPKELIDKYIVFIGRRIFNLMVLHE
jgi:hypothetical protein